MLLGRGVRRLSLIRGRLLGRILLVLNWVLVLLLLLLLLDGVLLRLDGVLLLRLSVLALGIPLCRRRRLLVHLGRRLGRRRLVGLLLVGLLLIRLLRIRGRHLLSPSGGVDVGHWGRDRRRDRGRASLGLAVVEQRED